MAPILSFLISSGSRKKEHRCACLSVAKASYSHKMWTEMSFSIPNFLQLGLLLSPITCKCLLRVLRPVRRPITALDCVLLKDNNRALVDRLGTEICSWTWLCVLQGPCLCVFYTITLFTLFVPKCWVWTENFFRETCMVHRIIYNFIYFFTYLFILFLI